ncbi:hypothetical protein BEH94_07330 [Candidatus Altiarchaeales archaeon WOR_SM1_SCG]|nr:hypothetical protein BEH94_07330 [Candidatus Altiarchaeales archaeon WOR_SM1_SCG]
MMEFRYREGKPVLPIRIMGDAIDAMIELIGVFDSGADFCTAPRDICEELKLERLREQEIFIPGGSVFVPVFKGIMGVDKVEKKVEIIGIELHPKLNIDCLIGRNLFCEFNVHLLGKENKLVWDTR